MRESFPCRLVIWTILVLVNMTYVLALIQIHCIESVYHEHPVFFFWVLTEVRTVRSYTYMLFGSFKSVWNLVLCSEISTFLMKRIILRLPYGWVRCWRSAENELNVHSKVLIYQYSPQFKNVKMLYPHLFSKWKMHSSLSYKSLGLIYIYHTFHGHC